MLSLYDPVAKAFFNTNGVDGVSPQLLQLNILIELRALHELMRQLNQNVTAETGSQMRLDVVNATLSTGN